MKNCGWSVLIVVFGLVLWFSTVQGTVSDLPNLDLIPRMDWYNVKLNGSATGDGVSDDTNAIQEAINLLMMNDTSPSVLYFPPGNYRLTRRLVMGGKRGVQLLGHGAPSRLFADPPVGSNETRLFHSNGNPVTTYSGIHWDGSGKIRWGFVHAANELFEAQVRHEFSIFSGFTEAAFRAGGTGQAYASSEWQVRNCVFMNNPRYCVYVQDPNYYNLQFIGNDFFNCGTGISLVYFSQGSMWRNHFEGSTDTDIEGGEPSFTHSIRQSSSIGSNTFFRHDSITTKLNMQSVTVEGWSNPTGAIVVRDRFPRPMIDLRFINPPSEGAPILFNPVAGWRVDKILGGIVHDGSGSPVANMSTNPFWTINRTPSSSVPPRGDASWRVARPNVGSSVIDCALQYVVPFRARGFRNDTAAIQACIDEAKRRNNNTVAYFRKASFFISSTVVIEGGNYIIEGAGYQTTFQWRGPCGLMFLVRSPSNITIRNFRFFPLPLTGGCIGLIHTRHPSATGGSFAYYDRIFGNQGTWYTTPQPMDLMIFDGLSTGDKVHINTIELMVRIRNSARAIIYAEFIDCLPAIIEGEESIRDGFIGFESMNGLNLQVLDNQELTIADFYFEQSGDWGNKPGIRPMYFRGARNNTVPSGSIVIGNAKAMVYDTNVFMSIDDYDGSISWMWPFMANSDDPTKTEWLIEHNATSSNLKLNLIGILGQLPLRVSTRDPASLTTTVFPNTTSMSQSVEGMQAMSRATDAIAKLIEIGAAFNPIQRYTRTEVTAPTVTPNGGIFGASVNVYVNSPEAASIRYTLDGRDPTGPTAQTVPAGGRISIPFSCTIKLVATHPLRSWSEIVSVPFVIDNSTGVVQNLFDTNSTRTTTVKSYFGGSYMHLGTQFMPVVPGVINRLRFYATPAEAGPHWVRFWQTDKPGPFWNRPRVGTLLLGPFIWQVPNTTGWVYYDVSAIPVEAGNTYIVDISTTSTGRAGIFDFWPKTRQFLTSGFVILPRDSHAMNLAPWGTPSAGEATSPHAFRDVEFLPNLSGISGNFTEVPPIPDAPGILCDNSSAPIIIGRSQPGAIVYAVGFGGSPNARVVQLGQVISLADGSYTIPLPRGLNGAYQAQVMAMNNRGLSAPSNSSAVTVTQVALDPTCAPTLNSPSVTPIQAPSQDSGVQNSSSNLGWIAAVVILPLAAVAAIAFAIYRVKFRNKLFELEPKVEESVRIRRSRLVS